MMTANGDFRVSRRLDGKWAANPVPVKQSADIQQGANKTNKLRVRFEGQTLTLFINGKEQSNQRLQAPGGSTCVGIYA